MFRIKDRLTGVVVKLLSVISNSLFRPAAQRIPVRMNHLSIRCKRG